MLLRMGQAAPVLSAAGIGQGSAYRFLMLLVLGALLGGCDRRITEPELDSLEHIASRTRAEAGSMRRAGAVVEWNEVARELVVSHSTTPPHASRVYALVSVAQHEALLALGQRQPGRSATGALQPPAARMAVAAASSAVLAYLYPQEAGALTALAQEQQETLRQSTQRLRGDLAEAIALGERAAEAVIERARTDGSDAVWNGTVPTGPGLWYSSADPPQPPLLPFWGQVRPWFMSSGSQFRPPPPPAFGSPEFQSALAEVRYYSDHRTPEQLRIALFWADGPGTYTPPGHWNEIATGLIRRYRLDELRAARVLAHMNMAVMDAGISCWDAKFTYWLIRPSQVDPEITTPPGLPNFPSYTSGHASFSGAASEVLGYFFPAERKRLRAMAEEAALSRLYGGIHYRFDNEKGLEAGRTIARLAIERGRQLIPDAADL